MTLVKVMEVRGVEELEYVKEHNEMLCDIVRELILYEFPRNMRELMMYEFLSSLSLTVVPLGVVK